MRSTVVVALLVAVPVSASAQRLVGPESRQLPLVLDSLRNTPGPVWSTGQSKHFILYVERPTSAVNIAVVPSGARGALPLSSRAQSRDLHSSDVARMLDSLETAWTSALELLGARYVDETRIPVFVTRSRSRFGRLVPPEAKGLTTSLTGGGDVMILVQNDSVRAHTRHEVMHLVSRRAWGASRRYGPWLIEGLATFADARCQTSSIRAVGRDLLASRRSVVADDLLTNFVPMWRSDRAAAYVLAGTFVDYLWASRGRDGVHRLWQGIDTLSDAAMVPGLAGELTSGWRAHVARVAGSSAGLDTAAFRRLGCG